MPVPLSKPTMSKLTPVAFVPLAAMLHIFIRPAPFATPSSIAVILAIPHSFAQSAARSNPNARGVGQQDQRRPSLETTQRRQRRRRQCSSEVVPEFAQCPDDARSNVLSASWSVEAKGLSAVNLQF